MVIVREIRSPENKPQEIKIVYNMKAWSNGQDLDKTSYSFLFFYLSLFFFVLVLCFCHSLTYLPIRSLHAHYRMHSLGMAGELS